MAAGTAALAGAQVTLLEKGPMTGRKLRITGKGRCNITNTATVQEFIKAFEPNGKFLYGPLSRFANDDLIRFMHEIGVQTKVERGGRVFPESDSAVEVATKLYAWAERAGVQIKTGTRAAGICVVDGKVEGVEIFGGKIPCDGAIIATGGLSYPKTGSNGEGYAMAQAVGHTLIPQHAALSGLNVIEKWVKDAQGLALKNVEAQIWPSGATKPLKAEFGEMLFTHFGVSGPIILTISRCVPKLLESSEPPELRIDLKPAVPYEELDDRVLRATFRANFLHNYLKEVVPHALTEVIPRIAHIPIETPLNKITHEERTRLVTVLKGLPLHIKSMRPIDEAIVTAGGVELKEVDPRTMESKLVQGLFFAGEVLDIDAETGGFNLQAAFTTGYIAGQSAACG
jgi:predicted Rossmann fold flavoprotein